MAHKLNQSRKDPSVYLLIGPYDAKLVRWLKDELPYHARSWDETLKAWRIDAEYADKVCSRIELVEALTEGQ